MFIRTRFVTDRRQLGGGARRKEVEVGAGGGTGGKRIVSEPEEEAVEPAVLRCIGSSCEWHSGRVEGCMPPRMRERNESVALLCSAWEMVRGGAKLLMRMEDWSMVTEGMSCWSS